MGEIVEIVNHHLARALARRLLVAKGVDAKLQVRDLLLLGPVVRLEVDNDHLVRRPASYEIDPTGHTNAITEVDLDRSLGVLDIREGRTTFSHVALEAADCRSGQRLPQIS